MLGFIFLFVPSYLPLVLFLFLHCTAQLIFPLTLQLSCSCSVAFRSSSKNSRAEWIAGLSELQCEWSELPTPLFYRWISLFLLPSLSLQRVELTSAWVFIGRPWLFLYRQALRLLQIHSRCLVLSWRSRQ